MMFKTKRDRNDIIRDIARVCGACPHGQGKEHGLVCTRKQSCPRKRVKNWLKELEKEV